MLGPLGLGPEEKIYALLLEQPVLNLQEIAEQSRTTQREARRLLRTLENVGLVALQPGRPLRFTASPPDVALEALLHHKEHELSQVRNLIPHLTDRFNSVGERGSPLTAVEVITGAQAVANRKSVLESSAEHEVWIFDRPPYVFQFNEIEIESLRRGVDYKVIYSRAAVELQWQQEALPVFVEAGEQARLLPELPMKMTVVDQHIAIVPLFPGAGGGLLIHPSRLLDGLMLIFETLWEKALPLGLFPSEEGTESREDMLDAEERELLSLLAMGLKDDAIARRLGVTRRTVQRRAAAFMTRVGATNRYQAGLQAGRRGWQ